MALPGAPNSGRHRGRHLRGQAVQGLRGRTIPRVQPTAVPLVNGCRRRPQRRELEEDGGVMSRPSRRFSRFASAVKLSESNPYKLRSSFSSSGCVAGSSRTWSTSARKSSRNSGSASIAASASAGVASTRPAIGRRRTIPSRRPVRTSRRSGAARRAHSSASRPSAIVIGTTPRASRSQASVSASTRMPPSRHSGQLIRSSAPRARHQFAAPRATRRSRP